MVRLSALHAGHSLPPGRFLVLIYVRGQVNPHGHSVAGRIRSIEKSIGHIGNATRDLPVCSTVFQPTMLPHAPGRRLLDKILYEVDNSDIQLGSGTK
jgi:hypothetical protein